MTISMATRKAAFAVAAVAALALGAGVLITVPGGEPPAVTPVTAPAPVPVPTASLLGATGGAHPWSAPLAVAAQQGELVDVEAQEVGADAVPGVLQPDGTWRSTDHPWPSTDYALVAVVRDGAGDLHRLPLSARTSDAEQLLSARLSPGDDKVVGIGQPVSVDLDRPVSDRAARALVEQRLSVTSTPSVVGSWRWMSDTQVHYRPERFWPAGTQVQVVSDLERLALPDGTFGTGRRTSGFAIGEAVVSTVDVAAHTVTVTRGGEVLRVLKASMGAPEFPTRGGTHLVLEKAASKVLDSDTVGLPGAYEVEVEWAVRLTYSGTFTHAAPWSLASQGVANVSHGCINLSPDDARWFFEQVRRGDVVEVVNATEGPLLSDPGAADWNLAFDQWRTGSALS